VEKGNGGKMSDGQVRVAVIGAGDIGRGWAACCVAAGWPVSIFDNNGNAANDAPEEIAERAKILVDLGRATPENAERGIKQLDVAGSLLKATREAQWIIESINEDLIAKQKLIEMLDSTSIRARAITSSSTGFSPTDVAARTRNKQRVMIAHPLNPPELIPLIELVAAPETDHALMELVKGWLRALGKIPITVKKPVPGHVVGRIAAAVWRESIDLVLNDVIDVDDLDRCVSLGPALGWAAAGPHLTYHLAAGGRGLSGFLQILLSSFEKSWENLADWSTIDSEKQRKLIHLIEKAYDGKIDVIRGARDRRLAGMLKGLEESRRG
jgi:carnitine 3-dehydrogenase